MFTTRMLTLALVLCGLIPLQGKFKMIDNFGALGDESTHPLPPDVSEVQVP
jgi:hypothetical protein